MTNFAKVVDEAEFIDTIDFIFVSDAVTVKETMPLPDRKEVGGPLPNAAEPSDHIMIGGTFEISVSK